MISHALIRERLHQAGVDESLCDVIYHQAYYGQLYGEEPEDFIQEAIMAALEHKDVKDALWKIRFQRYRTMEPIESIDVNFIRSSDNERPDWIPDHPGDKRRVVKSCRKAIEISYRPKTRQKYGYQGYLYVLGHQQFLGIYETNEQLGEAVRGALNRIIGWCSP